MRLFQPEEKIEEDKLSELRAEVDALYNDVLKADIDAELRTVLLGCLESFRRAITDYQIRGAEGLRDAAVKTIGELVVIRPRVNPKDESWVDRLWGGEEGGRASSCRQQIQSTR